MPYVCPIWIMEINPNKVLFIYFSERLIKERLTMRDHGVAEAAGTCKEEKSVVKTETNCWN